jgi:hypothetical protein
MRLAGGTHLWCGRPVPYVVRSGLEGESSGGGGGRGDEHGIPKEEVHCGHVQQRQCRGVDRPMEGMEMRGSSWGFFWGKCERRVDLEANSNI